MGRCFQLFMGSCMGFSFSYNCQYKTSVIIRRELYHPLRKQHRENPYDMISMGSIIVIGSFLSTKQILANCLET